MAKTTPESQDRALQILTKWRKFFASWQLGTRPPESGEYRAVAHQAELLIIMRAELNALTGVLIKTGRMTVEEFNEALETAAYQLSDTYAEAYPGWSATIDGLSMKVPEALDTMHRLGFPP